MYVMEKGIPAGWGAADFPGVWLRAAMPIWFAIPTLR